MMINETVIVRGGGDIASGTIQKLFRSGFKVLILEAEKPTSIRRNICFSEAVYDGYAIIEGIKSVLTWDLDGIRKAWEEGFIPVIVDTEGSYIQSLKPIAVVDAILAKRNLGTSKKMAPITVALGPGFEAGKDVDIVIETMRGHNLGRLIFEGSAMENTGVPGEIGGFSKERVIYSPFGGKIKNVRKIGDFVEGGEIIAYVEQAPVKTSISGVLRGIIRDGNTVVKGLKIADVDPRYSEKENCYTISDKARSIGGGVLEAILFLKNNKSL
jgi:xanthine dehydrogenase accessory factor